ncbi:uncharacterized protein BT62DRAFT_928180 [Guyanagaster necrorhizus]|uniref:Uncharacterized protein n=1 Tax=Guyanagaster necrorhizus TaxID=856835 RepID=A0A9P8AX68_9AGAR|nr:uncharacterized protein BT62DRAFT_928180 [Guyanagaster necrorhizus MCA 3950]KAG7450891.1 hypothetical protein BT62DRAFT_928180 [Guyanagaster necrorhizus MCA 3950]
MEGRQSYPLAVSLFSIRVMLLNVHSHTFQVGKNQHYTPSIQPFRGLHHKVLSSVMALDAPRNPRLPVGRWI